MRKGPNLKILPGTAAQAGKLMNHSVSWGFVREERVGGLGCLSVGYVDVIFDGSVLKPTGRRLLFFKLTW